MKILERYKELLIALGLMLCLNGLDYVNLLEPYRLGKVRWCLLALVPVVFVFFSKRLHWAPAFVGAIALWSYVTHHYPPEANAALISILACLSLASVVVEISEDLLAPLLVYSGVLQAVMALGQKVGINLVAKPVKLNEWYDMVGTYGHRTTLGAFLVACLVPALWTRRWIPAAVMVVAISLLNSTMTWASLAAVFLMFTWRFGGSGWAILMGYFITFGVVLAVWLFPNFSGFDLDGRIQMWTAGIMALREAPWAGAGIAGWQIIWVPAFAKEFLRIFGDSVPLQLHCDPLDFALEYGIRGLLVLLVALAQFVRGLRPTWQHTVCVALLVNCLGNFVICIISLALVFVVCHAQSQRRRLYAVD